jgi:branched-chain amino acid transport system permease protein
MIIFGPALVLLVIFAPRGAVGTFLTWMQQKAQAMGPAKKRQQSKVLKGDEQSEQEGKNNA